MPVICLSPFLSACLLSTRHLPPQYTMDVQHSHSRRRKTHNPEKKKYVQKYMCDLRHHARCLTICLSVCLSVCRLTVFFCACYLPACLPRSFTALRATKPCPDHTSHSTWTKSLHGGVKDLDVEGLCQHLCIHISGVRTHIRLQIKREWFKWRRCRIEQQASRWVSRKWLGSLNTSKP